MHRTLVAAVKAFNRNPWSSRSLELLPRDTQFYDEDGLWTYHAHVFVDDQRFLRAYQRAVQAAGHDYGIRWRAHTLLWAAETARAVEGAFVECGTGRGFMASAICDYFNWAERPFYLYDTFLSTHPDAAGIQKQGGSVSPVYATSAEAVARNFADWPAVRLVIGRVPETLERGSPDRVAFLHVDLNHAAADEAAVRHFWPRLSYGGVMVFDDYGFQGYEATRAMADRLAGDLGFSVLASPTGQGVVVKAR